MAGHFRHAVTGLRQPREAALPFPSEAADPASASSVIPGYSASGLSAYSRWTYRVNELDATDPVGRQ
jgi:hypothetical protein